MADYAASPASDGGNADADGQLARRWIGELDTAERDTDRQAWLKQCRDIIKLYKESRPRGKQKRFSLLWSNIQTLAPAVYTRTPKAVVTRRFKDNDPVGRLASEVLERSVNFALDTCDFGSVMIGCRDEYLLLALGQAWVRYVPTLRTETPPSVDDPDEALEGDAPQAEALEIGNDPEPYEVVDWEEVTPDRLHYEDFLHNQARSWQEVRWCARRAFMTRDELVARFPDCGKDVPLDWAPPGKEDGPDEFKKGAIYEIWDLTTKRAIWVCKTYPSRCLDVRDDPLKLEGFFPCPKPVFGTLGPDSLVPVPDWVYWRDQSDEIDNLTTRIDKLIDALRVRGFYSAADGSDLNTLLKADDNIMVPVDSWAALGDSGGLKGIIDWFPVEQIGSVLKSCFDARRQLIADVYQITGISDIQRGASDPDETAAAQEIKASWGGLRVRDRQKELERFSRDLIRIMGQIIAARFDAKTLAAMTGVQLLTAQERQEMLVQIHMQQQAAMRPPAPPMGGLGAGAPGAAPMAPAPPPPPPPPIPPDVIAQIMQPTWDDVTALLRNPSLRAFRIDIETDSTIEPDEAADKARRVEFVQAVGKYLAESLPVVQQAPQMLPVIVEGLKFLVRGFRVGAEMEDVIDRAADQLAQAAQAAASAPPQQPPTNPADMAKAQAAQTTAQAHMMQASNDQQANQIDAARLASDHVQGMAAIAAENARTQAQQRTDLALAIHKATDRQFAHTAVSGGPLIAPSQGLG